MPTVARQLAATFIIGTWFACGGAGSFSQTLQSAPTVRAAADCPTEPHAVAINPDVVICHAAFAPLPVVPTEFDRADPGQLEKLRKQGDVLLSQINRREACGKGAKVRPNEACAILVYVLDERHRQDGLPWTYVVKVYRMSHPASGNIRDAVLFTVNSNNSEGRFGPGADEVWELLAEQRVKTSCKTTGGERVGMSISAAGLRPDICRSTGSDIRYRPMLLIGKGEAQRVLNRNSIGHHFKAPIMVKECTAAGKGGSRPSDC